MDSTMEARYPASISNTPAHKVALLKSGNPHLNGIMGSRLNQEAEAIRSVFR